MIKNGKYYRFKDSFLVRKESQDCRRKAQKKYQSKPEVKKRRAELQNIRRHKLQNV